MEEAKGKTVQVVPFSAYFFMFLIRGRFLQRRVSRRVSRTCRRWSSRADSRCRTCTAQGKSLFTPTELRCRWRMFRNRSVLIFTARKRSLRRLCFYRCLSVHRGSAWWRGEWDAWLRGGIRGCKRACMAAGGMCGCRGACMVAGGCGGGGVCGIRQDTVNEWAVSMLLECILVHLLFPASQYVLHSCDIVCGGYCNKSCTGLHIFN